MKTALRIYLFFIYIYYLPIVLFRITQSILQLRNLKLLLLLRVILIRNTTTIALKSSYKYTQVLEEMVK